MAPRRKRSASIEVEETRHLDKRANIPTTELADFVRKQELDPTKLLYPRDISRDPQLVWKGKDEQDAADLEIVSVPIYVQEKIEPRALIEDLRRRSEAGRPVQELQLFTDFDGLPFEDKVDFYHHEANWSNRLILGDSLLVMASLAEKEGLRGKVQTVYLDPPYGIRFGSNWQVSTRKREVSDGKAADVSRQPEQIKAFRDTWVGGVNSYLAYLRDRLTVARDLLTDSGSVFVQIGDENEHLVRSLLDEVFGSDNFVSLITFKKTSGATGEYLGGVSDLIVWYAKNRENLKFRRLFAAKIPDGTGGTAYTWVEDADGTRRRRSDSDPPDLRVLRMDNLTSQSQGREKGEGAASWFAIEMDGRQFTPTLQSRWKTNEEGMARLMAANRLHSVGNTLSYVRYLDDFPAFPINNFWDDTTIAGFGDPKVYVVQTNVKVVERCILMSTDPGDLVVDPTCGSGTTAYVAEQWGRRWITVDTSRVALAIARTRIMTARFPFYLLADSPEGSAKEAELGRVGESDFTTRGDRLFSADVRQGFVCRRVPHITLKSIAQNPDIKAGATRSEVEAAIARHAASEMLVDQPYVEPRRVRVAGRFTVESLSPHRMLDPGGDHPNASADTDAENGDAFVPMILDNLRTAGVQNTRREERLRFDRLEPWPGEWLSAAGEYTDVDGTPRRAAVSIGPEHGTVGPVQVKEAAKEALRGVGFDVLIVCGFAFDATVGETAREFGSLTVLPTKMNPDLAMGAGLLKTTGSANLFMVFGEPDVVVTGANGDVTVELRGLDVYDPTTGEVRSSSTDDIACWFIDTDYDQESFFVRHAYFTGADDPYEKLRRALRAEIDEVTWASLYSTFSRPFPKPSAGRIAVKVINHFGDEVMRVYEVS
jgi:adenine-specific DNA-methyltransferase